MIKYTIDEIKKIVEKENIRYIRLQFTDMDGFLKNVEIPSYRLDDASTDEPSNITSPFKASSKR